MPLCLGGENEIDETYLERSIKRMFLELDTDENKSKREQIIDSIADNILTLEAPSQHQQVFMKCKEQYGNGDVGLLFIFFLNVLKPKPGESFICSPDEPHAYL